jgi:hypothetical protein
LLEFVGISQKPELGGVRARAEIDGDAAHIWLIRVGQEVPAKYLANARRHAVWSEHALNGLVAASHQDEKLMDCGSVSSTARRVERIALRVVRSHCLVGDLQKLEETGYDDTSSVTPR